MYGISLIFIVVSRLWLLTLTSWCRKVFKYRLNCHRYYELCFIRVKGIQSMEFYPAYLFYIEKNHPEESRNLVSHSVGFLFVDDDDDEMYYK